MDHLKDVLQLWYTQRFSMHVSCARLPRVLLPCQVCERGLCGQLTKVLKEIPQFSPLGRAAAQLMLSSDVLSDKLIICPQTCSLSPVICCGSHV